MSDDELDQFAAKFINLWQENFSKAIADGKIIEYMMQAGNNMQQFYDNKSSQSHFAQPFATAVPNPFESWFGQHGRRDGDERLLELERRITALEGKVAKTGTKDKRRGQK